MTPPPLGYMKRSERDDPPARKMACCSRACRILGCPRVEMPVTSRPSFLIDGVVVCDAPGGTSSPSARQERAGDVEDEVAAGGVEPGGPQGTDERGQDGVAFGPAGAAGPDPAGA